MILNHNSAQYRVGNRVAEAAKYRVYICEDAVTNEQYLLQIATEIEHNGGLDRAAFVLRELKHTSDLLEEEYAKQIEDQTLNYDRLFPFVVNSFVSEEQGKRRVNILSLKDVGSLSEIVPLSNLRNRDGLRIDLPSSAWIMGRLLKLLGLAHSKGTAVRILSGSNILIGPQNHSLVVFDWSSVHTYQQVVPFENRADDIANAAQAVFAAIGGDLETLTYPYTADNEHQYIKYLSGLTKGQEGDAERAHTSFYELVDELFGRGFRPFKSLPL